MRAWIASHWRVIVASTAAVALVAGVGVWVAVQPDAADNAVDCTSLEAETYNEAGELSRACGADVEVLSERTPWQTSFATSNNAARLDSASIPKRVQVNGEWVPVDSTLVLDPKTDTIRTTATVFPINLNPGGEAGRGKPLGTIENEDQKLQVWFPLDLPKPEMAGSQLFYAIDKGIRLVVTINGDATGFMPVIELLDAAAAARFTELLDAARAAKGGVSSGINLELVTIASDGLSVTVEEGGSVQVVDGAGETQFFSPAPIMWDSSGETITATGKDLEVSTTDRTQAPGGGDKISLMDVSLEESTIVVAPDVTMLESADTVWPVYIDPSYSGLGQAIRVAVRTGGYTGSLINWQPLTPSQPTSGQGTGNCNVVSTCTTSFKQRLAWQYNGLQVVGDMAGTDITSAQFKVYGSHSYDCTARKTALWQVSALSAGTLWGNLGWIAELGSRVEAHKSTCGTMGYREFDATNGAKSVADANSNYLALGLYVDESSMAFWKRFAADATLTINYNRAPDVPTSLQMTSPIVTTCTTGPTRPFIASTTPTISAISTDIDPGTLVSTAFNVVEINPTTSTIIAQVWSSGNLTAVTSGSRKTAVTPTLVNGKTYAWRAQAFDGARYSVAWSGFCEFTVDTSAPVLPTVTPVTSGVQAIYDENAIRGGVNQLGQFTLNRGASTDVISFMYGFPIPTYSVAADGSGNAVISYTPTTTGNVTLKVYAMDVAGNLSAAKTYQFVVASPTEDGAWILDEGTGTTAADTAGNPARPLTVSGAAWGDGPHKLFDSRPTDRALVFDGINDAATATGPVVKTLDSFVVTAHVLLNSASVAQGQSFTALSQDGVTQSGFKLGYTATCAGMPTGCWSFSMPDALTGTATTAVTSTVPVTGGQWVYLVGEHDLTDDMLRLWVCEIGTPTNPAVGEPVKSQFSRSGAAWAASGAFAVGRGLTAGASSGWWPGAIDNVRVFSGDVMAESKIRRLCQGAEASDFGGSTITIDPTSEVGK